MNLATLKKAMGTLDKAEDTILDLPESWQDKLGEKDIDWLCAANTIRDILDFLEEKFDHVIE